MVTDKQVAEGAVTGLERAISKNKGLEFASLLQQFAADYAASPFGTNIRAIVLEIDPDAKDRLPKRGGRKTAAGDVESDKPSKKSTKKKATKGGAKPTAKPTAKKKTVKKKTAAPEAKPKKKSSGAKGDKSIAKKAGPSAKKSTSKQLARRKPR